MKNEHSKNKIKRLPLFWGFAFIILIITVLSVGFMGPKVLNDMILTNSSDPSPSPTPIDALNADLLWNLIQIWREENNLSKLEKNDALCDYANQRLLELKSEWSTDKFKNRNKFMNNDIAENSARDYETVQTVLKSWLDNKTTKDNLAKSSYKIGCVVTDGYVTELLLSDLNVTETTGKTATVTNNGQNDSDPPVHCLVHPNCGGGTTPLKKSECDNSICCQIGSKWIFYKDKNQCSKDQGKNTNVGRSNSGTSKIRCSYNGGNGYAFDFGELTLADCTAKSNEYWASKEVAIPTYIFPTIATQISTSIITTQQVDEAACRSQYQTEIQAANSLGGSARDAAIEIATQSFNRCLSTGTIEVHTIQKAPSPTKVDSGYYGGHY